MRNLKKTLQIVLVLIACNAYSQTDTSKKKDSVTVAFAIAKKIHLDLLDYDRLIQNNVEINLKKCIRLQKEKDTLYNLLDHQYQLSQKSLQITEQQLKIREQQLKFNKKKKNGWLFGTGGAVVGTLIGLLISN